MPSLKRNSLLLALLWTGLLSALLFLNVREIQKTPVQQAEIQAKSLINSVISFRSWASSFGGVYVPVSEQYPPNPYLKTPKRDLTTTDGDKLTLVNPAYMTRQVFQDFHGKAGLNGHLTSLKPLNPNNKPDAWEVKSLEAFEGGSLQATTIEQTAQGAKVFRYMKPLYVEDTCMKCHAEQGYKVGDVRGGISTMIDLQEGEAIAAGSITSLMWTYGLIWLLGLGCCTSHFVVQSRLKQSVNKNSICCMFQRIWHGNSSAACPNSRPWKRVSSLWPPCLKSVTPTPLDIKSVWLIWLKRWPWNWVYPKNVLTACAWRAWCMTLAKSRCPLRYSTNPVNSPNLR